MDEIIEVNGYNDLRDLPSYLMRMEEKMDLLGSFFKSLQKVESSDSQGEGLYVTCGRCGNNMSVTSESLYSDGRHAHCSSCDITVIVVPRTKPE